MLLPWGLVHRGRLMFYNAVIVAGWPLGALVGLAVLAILLVEGSSRARRRGRRGLARLAIAGVWITLPLSLVACRWLYQSFNQPVGGWQAVVVVWDIERWERLLSEWLALAAANCLGILTVWAGLGRAHWFLRTLTLTGTIALPMLISAHELVLMGLVQSVVTIVPLVAIRFFRTDRSVRSEAEAGAALADKRPGPRKGQYALRDLFLGTLLAAMLLGMAAAIPQSLWIGPDPSAPPFFVAAGLVPLASPGVFFAAWGTVFALGVLVAAWVALRRESPWSRLVAVLPAVPMVSAMLWLALWRGSSGRRKWPARAALTLLSMVLLVPLAIVYCRLLTWPPRPEPVLPEPNAYVLALEAGKKLEGVLVPEATDPKAVKAAFCAAHRSTIDQGRRALDYPSCAPLQFTEADDIQVDDMQHFRQLARALAAAADLAIEEGRLSEAVACHGDVMRLSRAEAHGGVLIHWLVGMAIEGIGLDRLHRLVGSLAPEQCRTAASLLARGQADRESFDEVNARDQVWTAHAMGWRGRLSSILAPLASRAAGKPRDYQTIEDRREARVRIVLTELAVRAYLVEQGRRPGNLADLVPAYLPAVPDDPASGEPLVYRREGAGYRVSSPTFSDENLWAPPPAAARAKDDSAGEPPEEQEPG